MSKGYEAPEKPESAKKAGYIADKAIKEAQSKDFVFIDDNGKQRVDYIRFSSYFLEQYNLIYIDNKKEASLMLYREELGYWEEINMKYLKHLVNTELGTSWTYTTHRDAFAKITSSIKHVKYNDFYDFKRDAVFNFQNGVFNWKKMKLEEHDSKYYFTGVAGIELNTSNIESELLTDKWFRETFEEDAQTIKEFIGYSFFSSYRPIQAFVILLGNGDNGKSTFINYLADIIGRASNAAFVPLQDITSENSTRFKISELAGKYANFNADISDAFIKKPDVLKNLTGGDWINADVKGASDVQINNFAKMLFATNKLPPVRDTTKGFSRRANILQFNEILDFNNKYDWDKILKERSAFIWECIKLANDAMKRRKLFKSERNQTAVKEWLYSNNPIKEFLADCTIEKPDNEILREKVYNTFCNWCNLNGYSQITSRKFYKALRDDEGITEIKKKERYKSREYYFTGISLNSGIDEKHPADRFK